LAELDRQTPRILAEQRADAVKEGVAQGVAQGVAEGVAQGVDKAVEELLAAAAAYLPPETIEALRKQRDPVAIALAMAGAAR
jgi:flagellar biosynthesis/type III secretory pathway protein FliH